MLSKSKIKLLQSLKHKKFRQKYKIFLVEGHKSVDSLLQQNKFDIDQIYATQSWSDNHGKPAFLNIISIAEPKDLKKLSEHKSAPEGPKSKVCPDPPPNRSESDKGEHVNPNSIQIKSKTL